MLTLDPRTVILITAAICVMQTLTLGLFYRLVSYRYRAMAWWIWSSLVHALGFTLLALRGLVPDLLSVVAANAALAATLALLLGGINRFIERPQPGQERLAIAIVALMTVALIPLTYVAPSLTWRTVLVSLAVGALNLLCAWSLARGAPPDLRAGAWFTAAILAGNGAWLLARAGLVATAPDAESLFSPTVNQLGVFIATAPGLILWLAGAVALVTQRLLRDVRTAQDAERAALRQVASDAAEQERRRLARELHDAVSQALFAANRTAEVLPQLWELDPEEGRRALADLHRFTTAALAEMRALLVELRPPALAEVPLHETLALLAPTVRARGVADVQAHLEPAPLLPPDVQLALYRIAQEALSNATRHARPRRVSVSLRVAPACIPGEAWAGTITVAVADDGSGFVVAPAPAGRFGLATMAERSAEIGAALDLETAPGAGTRVTVRWQGVAQAPPPAPGPLTIAGQRPAAPQEVHL